MEMDFRVGQEIKEKLMPHAVLYFTGEAVMVRHTSARSRSGA